MPAAQADAAGRRVGGGLSGALRQAPERAHPGHHHRPFRHGAQRPDAEAPGAAGRASAPHRRQDCGPRGGLPPGCGLHGGARELASVSGRVARNRPALTRPQEGFGSPPVPPTLP